jgi:hypothetical protein
MVLSDPTPFLQMTPPPAPDRPGEGPLDPVALAWYRHRLATGHYDSEAVLERLTDALVQAGPLVDPPAPPAEPLR